MTAKKSRKSKRKNKKVIMYLKDLTPYKISLFCLGVVIILAMSMFLGSFIFHKETVPQTMVETNTLSIHSEEAPSVTKPVHFEFYSTLPNNKVVKVHTSDPTIEPNAIQAQSKLGLKPHSLSIFNNAKELENDVLRHIKHKE